MQIKKNGKIYEVRENSTSWTLFSQIGCVLVKYIVNKSDCSTFEILKEFINENELF